MVDAFSRNYYQLLNIWPSVQFLCLEGDIRIRSRSTKPSQPCCLRLREFRWKGSFDPSGELLNWLLRPSLGTLEAIHVLRDSTRHKRVATALIATHAPYLRSLRLPFWNDAITQCFALEELNILYSPWPRMDQIRALKRLRHLIGYADDILEIFGPPSDLQRPGGVRELSLYAMWYPNPWAWKRKVIAALKSEGVGTCLFGVECGVDPLVSFSFREILLISDGCCLEREAGRGTCSRGNISATSFVC